MPPSDDDSPRFLCVEITSNWPAAWPAQDMAAKLEVAIANQLERGYRLHSWNGWAVSSEERRVTETVVAVFERVERDEHA